MAINDILQEYTLSTTIIEPITFSGPFPSPITVNVNFVKIGRSVTVTIPDVLGYSTTSIFITSSTFPETMYSDTQMLLPNMVKNATVLLVVQLYHPKINIIYDNNIK